MQLLLMIMCYMSGRLCLAVLLINHGLTFQLVRQYSPLAEQVMAGKLL